MKFRVCNDHRRTPSVVSFDLDSSSIDVAPKPEGGITSLLINDLQLEVSDEGKVLYAWGLFPHYSRWAETLDYPQSIAKRDLVVEPTEPLIPGVSLPINRAARWTAFINRQQGWLCLGDHKLADREVVEFANETVAVLASGEIVAIWIHPEFMGGQNV